VRLDDLGLRVGEAVEEFFLIDKQSAIEQQLGAHGVERARRGRTGRGQIFGVSQERVGLSVRLEHYRLRAPSAASFSSV
jgi:hypothetical protein